MTTTELPIPPFSAKEWAARAWIVRFEAWVRRYLEIEPQAWQLQLTQKFFELSPGPQPLPSTFRAYQMPELTEEQKVTMAHNYIKDQYGLPPRITRYIGDEGYYGYATN
jgi:hypothetical protein